MKLNNSFFWAAVIFVAFLFFVLFYVFSGDFKFASISNTIIVIAAILISAVTVSLVLALIISIFSIRKKKFKKQLSFISPLIFMSIVLLFSFAGFLYKKGVEYSDSKPKWLVKYRDVKCPPGLDYASIKTGSFSAKELEIERNDSMQIQKDHTDNTTEYYYVTWLKPCEYMLTNKSNNELKLFVKVTGVDETSYSCYFISDTTSMPIFFMRILKNNTATQSEF